MPSATPAPVIVNVYDLADFNAYLNWCGMGAYHSGLQVHGREWAYGGVAYMYQRLQHQKYSFLK